MEQGRIEEAASGILKEAGYGERAAPGALTLAESFRIPVRKVDPILLRGLDACLLRLNSDPQIFVRRGLGKQQLRFAVCRELTEWRIPESSYTGADWAAFVRRVAAALLMPLAAFCDSFEEHRFKFDRIAQDFCASQSAVAMRLGEAMGTPVAVLSPACVNVRGNPWAWPESERELRQLAANDTDQVRKFELTDGLNRCVLVPAESV